MKTDIRQRNHEQQQRIGVTAVAAFALLVLSSVRATADVTNDVDVTALSAFGNAVTGETNGWFVSRVDSYEDGQKNVRLAAKGDYLLSPDFGRPIRRFVLQIKSSSQLERRLAFVPWDGLLYDTAKALLCDFSPTKDSYVAQELAVPAEVKFSRFKVALIGEEDTAWGIRQLGVVTDDAPHESPALAAVSTNATGAIRLSSCRRANTILFNPNFAVLAEIGETLTLTDGWFPPFCARAFAEDETVGELKPNGGSTTIGGHYVWNTRTEGLGTYTSSGKARSWRWIFANDTDGRLQIDSLAAAFGQWGAHNSLPDTLSCHWVVSTAAGDPVSAQAEPAPTGDTYVSAYTNDSQDAQYPALERRELSHPRALRPGEILTLTFRDTCPAKGSNAALGIAGLRLLAHPINNATILQIR